MLLTQPKLSLKKAITAIALSTLLFSGIPYCIVLYKKANHLKKSKDKRYLITQLVQTGPVKEAIKSEHLQEILGLSHDKAISIVNYDLQNAYNKLAQTGVFEEAEIRLIEPNTLHIDYQVRQPLAYIEDYRNLVIDASGVLFPLKPYFTPKRLPKIYLGVQISPLIYGSKLQLKKYNVAKEILTYLQKLKIPSLFIYKVDVSKLYAPHLGLQEIVVTLYETLGGNVYRRYLRLPVDHYLESLDYYLDLKSLSLAKDYTLDLRLMPNAYLTELEEKP